MAQQLDCFPLCWWKRCAQPQNQDIFGLCLVAIFAQQPSELLFFLQYVYFLLFEEDSATDEFVPLFCQAPPALPLVYPTTTVCRFWIQNFNAMGYKICSSSSRLRMMILLVYQWIGFSKRKHSFFRPHCLFGIYFLFLHCVLQKNGTKKIRVFKSIPY